jgi:SWI/SNF related-matrix-associated actin-dependent regulator of chromatin subfamily C
VLLEIVHRDAQEDRNLEGRNEKGDNSPSVLDDTDLSNGHNNKKIKDCAPEETQNGESTGKPHAAKEQDVKASCEEVRRHNLDDTSNSDVPKDHPQSTMKESDNLTSKVELPPSSGEEPQERTSVGEPSQPAEALKDVHMVSDSPSAEKNELQQPVPSDSVREPPQPTEAPRDAGMLSDSLPLEKNGPDQPVTTSSVGKPQPTEASTDVDMVSDSLPSEKNEPQQPVTKKSVEEPSQTTEAPKDVVMVSDSLPSEKNASQQPVTTISVVDKGASKGLSLSLSLCVLCSISGNTVKRSRQI